MSTQVNRKQTKSKPKKSPSPALAAAAPAPTEKRKRGRPARGLAARALRWSAIVTPEEDGWLREIAQRYTGGNLSLALIDSVRIMREAIDKLDTQTAKSSPAKPASKRNSKSN